MRSSKALAVAVLVAFVLLALQSGAVMTILALSLDDLGSSTDVGSSMAFFLAANLVGMSVGGLLCRWLPTGRVVVVCMVVGALGLGIAALARDLPAFLVGRSVQGAGNGACMVALYVIAAVGFAGTSRARLLRGISTAWMLPTIAGPAFAGAAAEHFGWRTVFVIGAVGLLLAGALIGASSNGLGQARSNVLPRVVAAGVLAAIGVCGLQTLPAASVVVTVAVAACSLVLVLVGALVMLPPRTLVAGRGAPSGIALRGILAGAFFGVEAWVPLLLIEQERLSAELAGVVIGLGGIAWIAGAWYRGARRSDAAQADTGRGLAGSCLVVAVGMAGLAVTTVLAAPALVVGIAWALACFGMGAALPLISILVFEKSSVSEYAEASVGLQTSDALGCAVVVALCGVVFATLHPYAASPAYAAVFGIGGCAALFAVVVAPRLSGARAVAIGEWPSSRR